MNTGMGGRAATGGRCVRLRTMLAVVLAFALAQAGHAENADGHAYLYQDRAFQLGPLQFSPGARAEVMYSDNVLNSPGNRRDDVLLVYSPLLNLKLRPSDLATFNFKYAPKWNDYAKDTIDDYFTHNASAALDLGNLFTPGFNLKFSAAFDQAQNTGLIEDELLRFQKYEQLQYGIAGSYTLAQGSIRGEFQRNFLSYAEQQGSSVGTQTTDLAITRRIHARKLVLVLRYSIDQTLPNEQAPPPLDPNDPANAANDDPGNVLAINSPVGSDSHSLLMGFKGKVGRFSYDATAGVTAPQIIYPGRSPINPDLKAELRYNPNDRLEFSLLLARGSSTDARLGRVLRRTPDGGLEILNVGDTGTRQSVSFYASVGWQMNARIRTDLEIGRYSVTGIQTGSSTDTRISAGATLQMTTRGKLDLAVSRTNSERGNGTRLTRQYSMGFGWKFSDFATASIKLDRDEDHTSDDSPGVSERLDTIVDTAQIGVTVTW